MPTRLALTSLLVVLALLSGCGGDSSNTSEDSFTGELTLEDGFDEAGTWPEDANEFVTYGVSEGELRMEFKQPRSVTIWPNELFRNDDPVVVGDSVATVDVQSETAESPILGLLCRWDDQTTAKDLTGYAFVLSSRPDQGAKWQLDRGISGDVQTLASGDLDLDLAEEAASLDASCVGQTLTFRINGEEVAGVTDGNLNGGSNGFFGYGGVGRPFPLTGTFDNYVLEYDEKLGEG